MSTLQMWWIRFKVNADKGQGTLEYALVLVLVAVLLIILVQILGSGVSDLYQSIVDELNNLPS